MRVMGMIDGKIAIVTGSGRGIGAAAAKKSGAEGASVVVSDIDPAPAEETVVDIRNAGGSAIAVVGDVISHYEMYQSTGLACYVATVHVPRL